MVEVTTSRQIRASGKLGDRPMAIAARVWMLAAHTSNVVRLPHRRAK
jgi:hypothetical protein